MLDAPLNVAHALCVYAEPLAARRRVVVVGDSSLGLDARLVALGARTVHVYDPDAARARASALNAARGVVVRELPAGEFDVREGAFDLAIVPDLAILEDRAGLLVRVRRLVGPDGSAIIAARSAPPSGESAASSLSPGASASTLDYYEMYDLVALQFASVRMIGQVPFAGVALAELGESDDEPAVSVDTQLIEESTAPEVYIALAAQRDVRLEPYTIVQLPNVASSAQAVADPSRAFHSIGPSQADLASAVLRAELAEAQLDEQRAVVLRLTGDAERSSRKNGEAEVAELEASLHDRTSKLKEAETRAGDHYVRAERLTHDLRRLEEELQRQRDRAVRLTKELDDEKKAKTRAEVDLGLLRKSPDLGQARERVALLEEALRAAEEVVGVLQARAVEAEKLILQREAQVAALARQLEAARAEIASVPRVEPEALTALASRAQQAEARAQHIEARARQIEAEAQRVVARAEQAELRSQHADARTQEAEARAQHAEARTALLDAQLAEHADGQGSDLAELERILRERAQAIAGLEQELVRRERMIRELLGALEEAGALETLSSVAGTGDSASHIAHAEALQQKNQAAAASAALDAMRTDLDRMRGENGELRGKLDGLALEVARREAELQARSWRIAELDERVASLEARPSAAIERPTPAAPDQDHPLVSQPPPQSQASAQGELNALRQALAQEHEARVALESGDELARARADLARQSVLLEQLARELESRDRARLEGPGQEPGAAQT